MKAGILTVSDKGSKGLRVDASGPMIKKMLLEIGCETVEYKIVPDERELISSSLKEMCEKNLNFVFTTGGTGFSKRDVTPEATLDVIEREIPGIPEAMRYYSLQITPKAMLSRSRAGILKNSIIINLPGSEKAVKENLECILPVLSHGSKILIGEDSECAAPIR